MGNELTKYVSKIMEIWQIRIILDEWNTVLFILHINRKSRSVLIEARSYRTSFIEFDIVGSGYIKIKNNDKLFFR